MGSPLGRYSELGATIVSVGVIAAWVSVHILPAFVVMLGGATPAPLDTTQLDLGGVMALGIVLGQRATTNGAAKIAAAAHARLDAIHAPSSNDGAGPPA